MPLHLPAGVASPGSASAWARALNNRDFQDKQLRVVQYGSRGLAYCLLRSDEGDQVGLMLFRLYAQLSLSRKAFRAFRWLADLKTAIEHMVEALREPSNSINWLTALQWLLMAMHIFWDNMFFVTHSAVWLIARPESPRWSNASANLRQKNWRTMSDVVGLMAACVQHHRARRRALPPSPPEQAPAQKLCIDDGKDTTSPGSASWQAAASLKQRETRYAAMKLAADVATYFPQTTLAMWIHLSHRHGWHDAYIGITGCIAALLSCRSEWIKLNN